MENASLVGLSRQIALQRELDVVANNIANLNTTGFKADNVVFHEHLMPVARANHFRGNDRQVSFVQDRATWLDLARARCSRPAIRSTSRSAATRSSPCRRRAANATRATARCRSTAPGQLVTSEGLQVIGQNGPIVFQPNDRDISIGDRRHHLGARGPEHHRFAARQAASSRASTSRSGCRRTAPRPTWRRPACTPQAPRRRARQCRARSRNRTCNSVIEMTRMVEVTRTYTQIASMLQQQSDMRRTAIEKLAEVPNG